MSSDTRHTGIWMSTRRNCGLDKPRRVSYPWHTPPSDHFNLVQVLVDFDDVVQSPFSYAEAVAKHCHDSLPVLGFAPNQVIPHCPAGELFHSLSCVRKHLVPLERDGVQPSAYSSRVSVAAHFPKSQSTRTPSTSSLSSVPLWHVPINVTELHTCGCLFADDDESRRSSIVQIIHRLLNVNLTPDVRS